MLCYWIVVLALETVALQRLLVGLWRGWIVLSTTTDVAVSSHAGCLRWLYQLYQALTGVSQRK